MYLNGDATCKVCVAYSCWSNDHACPPCQSHVFVILKAPADCAIAFTLLPLFELFQQTKIAWNFNWRREERLHQFKYISEHSRFGLQIPKRSKGSQDTDTICKLISTNKYCSRLMQLMDLSIDFHCVQNLLKKHQ